MNSLLLCIHFCRALDDVVKWQKIKGAKELQDFLGLGVVIPCIPSINFGFNSFEPQRVSSVFHFPPNSLVD